MATKHSTPLCNVERASFDPIVFNFPHAGFPDTTTMIQKHRELVGHFFTNAICMLLPGGEVHVSHKLGDAYDEWKLEELAQMVELRLVQCIFFKFEAFPGYRTRRGADKDAGRLFPLGKASTYIFAARNTEQPTYVLNPKTEHEVPLTTWNTIKPELLNFKAKLVQKGQASEETPLLEILVEEVTRLDKLSNQLGKKKITKFKLLNSALKEVKLYFLQEKPFSLSSLELSLDITSKPPKCLRFCEFCGASLKELHMRKTL